MQAHGGSDQNDCGLILQRSMHIKHVGVIFSDHFKRVFHQLRWRKVLRSLLSFVVISFFYDVCFCPLNCFFINPLMPCAKRHWALGIGLSLGARHHIFVGRCKLAKAALSSIIS